MDYVKEYLWNDNDEVHNGGIIKYVLDYIPEGHKSMTFDLWEEYQSNDLFWNKITSRKAMI